MAPKPKWSFSDSSADRARIPVGHETPVRTMPAAADDPRPRAAGREACPYCATHGDLGCEHFAPSAAENLPRDGRGLLEEKTRLGLHGGRFTPAEDKTLLTLDAAGDHSQREIAAILGRPRSSVVSRLLALKHREPA